MGPTTLPVAFLALVSLGWTSADTTLQESIEDFPRTVRPCADGGACEEEAGLLLADFWFDAPLMRESGKYTVIQTQTDTTSRVILIRPDYVAGSDTSKRQAFWVEAGFEANLFAGHNALAALAGFLKNSCTVHCQHDYYFVIWTNPAISWSLSNDQDWKKTRDTFPGQTCVGVDLLSNFNTSTWSTGNTDVCSENYRGPSPNSVPQTSYQSLKIALGADKIGFSLTISKVGASITTAGSSNSLSATETGYLNAFKTGARDKTGQNYEIGSYGALHGELDTGHPVNYNARYGLSFNWAMPKGVDSVNPYTVSPEQNSIDSLALIDGFLSMVDYYEKNLPVPTTKAPTTTAKSPTEKNPTTARTPSTTAKRTTTKAMITTAKRTTTKTVSTTAKPTSTKTQNLTKNPAGTALATAVKTFISTVGLIGVVILVVLAIDLVTLFFSGASGNRGTFVLLSRTAGDFLVDSWHQRHQNGLDEYYEPYVQSRSIEPATKVLDNLASAWKRWGPTKDE